MSTKSIEEIFGIHAARAALKNPRRKIYSLSALKSFMIHLLIYLKKKIEKIQILKRKEIDSLLGFNTHQGVFINVIFYKTIRLQK